VSPSLSAHERCRLFMREPTNFWADPPPSSYQEKRLRRVEKDAERRKEPRFRLAHLSAHELTRACTRPPSAHKLIRYIAWPQDPSPAATTRSCERNWLQRCYCRPHSRHTGMPRRPIAASCVAACVAHGDVMHVWEIGSFIHVWESDPATRRSPRLLWVCLGWAAWTWILKRDWPIPPWREHNDDTPCSSQGSRIRLLSGVKLDGVRSRRTPTRVRETSLLLSTYNWMVYAAALHVHAYTYSRTLPHHVHLENVLFKVADSSLEG